MSNRVRDAVDESFIDFLQRCKVEEAKRLLTETTHPTTQVAYRAGFSTSQLFSRVFRKITGYSPSQYRAQHKT